jgi:hypothetical protein
MVPGWRASAVSPPDQKWLRPLNLQAPRGAAAAAVLQRRRGRCPPLPRLRLCCVGGAPAARALPCKQTNGGRWARNGVNDCDACGWVGARGDAPWTYDLGAGDREALGHTAAPTRGHSKQQKKSALTLVPPAPPTLALPRGSKGHEAAGSAHRHGAVKWRRT